MLSIHDTAIDQPLSAELEAIVQARLDDARTLGLTDLTHLLVIHPDDTEQAIIDGLGWSPLVHPIDETRFGSAGFRPYWSWLQDLGGWYELLHTVGNDGFAYILLIEKGDSELSAMCAAALADESAPCES